MPTLALSLIVPQHHYEGVARWVNDRRLTHRRNDGRVVGSRQVYERMPARRVRVNSPAVSGALLLADTLEVREGFDWGWAQARWPYAHDPEPPAEPH